MNDEALMTNDEGMTKSEKEREYAEEAFWNEASIPIVREEPGTQLAYDLEERTAKFGEAVIDFAKGIQQNAVTNRLINQLVGAATSVGANYVEADDAVSKKEFLKSIGTCRKEARETKHFLRMIVRAVPELNPKLVCFGSKRVSCISSSQKFGEVGKINDEVKTKIPSENSRCFVHHSGFVINSSLVIRHSSL